jgi:competence protein ComEC
MTPTLLAFAAGVLALQLQPALPAPAWLWLLPGCLALGAWRREARLPAALALGFLWAAGFAHLRLADRLAPELEGRDIDVVGVVSSLPAHGERGSRFEFQAESSSDPLPGKVLLSWYRSAPGAATDPLPQLLEESVRPGERWRLTVRLRRPHGQVNPHGFDYEAWLLERGIGATGYVRPKPEPQRLGMRNSASDRIEQAREAVRSRYARILGSTPAAGILAALAVGDQRAISNEEWRLFQRTGVTHLMSISGLHVTMVSGLVAWLVAAFWRRVPALALRLPARMAAAPAAIMAAFGYALLSGFAVPAQRTFWMVTVVAAALWSGRIASPARTLALALAVVLALDPWAVLSAGFWLSFGAVALIFYTAGAPQRRATRWPRLRQALRIQWAITAGLAPATLFLFSQVSIIGPLANAVAIPLVSGVIAPLALLAAAVPVDVLAQLGAWLIEGLLQFLEFCAMLPAALWRQHVPALWCVLLAFAGALWLIAPRGVPWRAGGLALMAPAFALPAPSPAPGEAWITTLDVGQGLAVVVRTANRTLVYDAGPQFGADADSGERVVAPYLRATGATRVDMLVVTHNDNDHAGGAASVIANFEVDEFLSSLPAAHPLQSMVPGARRCRRGAQWQWDGVHFLILHPVGKETARRRSNDQSCVLRVSAGAASMLLTGDIERAAEEALLRRDAAALGADVLLVPHHGGRTSTGAPFLDAVRPALAVIPVGYRSRFGHPHPEVLGRLAAIGARVWRTDLDGAVSVRLGGGGVAAEGERARQPRYWRSAGDRALEAGG